MRIVFAVMLSLTAFFTVGIAKAAEPASFFDMSATSLAGEPIALSKYKGQLVMVVNVASRCGYTPQYKGLEALYAKYKDKGFTILGFPSNDFMHQEPGNAEQIQKFCSMKYGVEFPLFKKDSVKGDEIQPVYKYLVANAPSSEAGEVGWNFEKFLISPDGKVIDRWRSKVEPESDKITSEIEKNLPKAPSK